MRIETSMRIQDSLADGVSFFMAELRRLKQIVDIAREYEHRSDITVLFLLDENSARNQLTRAAYRCCPRHSALDRSSGDPGPSRPHDLELGRAEELVAACRPVHFRESFSTENGKQVMTFDYQVREGIATTTNALKLLKMVGLADGPNGLGIPAVPFPI